jgi:hypothetical protein
MKWMLIVLAGGVIPVFAKSPAGVDWQPLLPDPDSFAGFRQLGGAARYEIKDGVVTGTSVAKTPNSFMASEKEFGDFELEYEFKVDDLLNSGVQIRSHSRPDRQNGRVHGYQVEIDPSSRAWSGGIYDEGRRGWLNDLKSNPKAGAAFKHNDWNHVRVTAVGDSIKTWINGVPAADLRDAMDSSGFIALQVHGVGSDEKKAGTQVHWRNLRIKNLGVHSWQPVFDGKSLGGWTATPGGTWSVAGGAIHGVNPASDLRHGILLSDRTFGDFTARLQFKVNKGNSGFYFRCQRVDDPVTVHGFQAEICENDDTGGVYETGGRGWVAQTDKAAMEKDKVQQPGKWNELWVSAHGDRVVVHVNGRRTVDFIDSKQSRDSGPFGLQLHGGQDMDVEFKDLAVLSPGD